MDWNLLQGRDDITKAKDTIQINTEGSEQLVDELKLAPKVDGLSKYVISVFLPFTSKPSLIDICCFVE